MLWSSKFRGETGSFTGGGRQQHELEKHRPDAGVLTRRDGVMIGIGTVGEQEPCTGNGTLPTLGTTCVVMGAVRHMTGRVPMLSPSSREPFVALCSSPVGRVS